METKNTHVVRFVRHALVLLGLLAFASQSCQRQQVEPTSAIQENALSVSEAKQWYETTYPTALPLTALPNWQRASQQAIGQFLLVPLTT